MRIKFLKKASLLVALYFLISSCGKKQDSDLDFTISPSTITLLNVATQTCADRATVASTSKSAAASVAMFQKMSWSWKNTGRDLKIYAIRFNSTDVNFASKIDSYITGDDMVAFEGRDPTTAKTCTTCSLSRMTAGGVPVKYSFNTGSAVKDSNGADVAGTLACSPIVGGLTPAQTVTANFTAQVKVTLMAYSIDSDGNIQNEYAQVPVTVKYEVAP